MTRKMKRFSEWINEQPCESLAQLARDLGVPQQRIHQWISEERRPTPRDAAALADLFGIPTDDIYAMSGRIPPDIETALKNTTPDVFRAIRLYL